VVRLDAVEFSPVREKRMKVTCLLVVCAHMALCVTAIAADRASLPANPGLYFARGPQPGDVYREYTYSRLLGGHLLPEGGGEITFDLAIRDLQNAIRAEAAFEYWGGHIGTSEQRLIVNGHDEAPAYLPQPRGTLGPPEAYYRTLLGNSSVPVPLDLLHEGVNSFAVAFGSQVVYSFNWPHMWLYATTIRIYYDATKPHPTGDITAPKTGATIDDSPILSASAAPAGAPIKQVDFIGCYEDFDWEGNGVWRQWHYQTMKGVMKRNIGTATEEPYEVRWDTKWVPDQREEMAFMARVMDADGVCCMTQAVGNVWLNRARSVKLYKPLNVPENWRSRVNKKIGCQFDITHELKGARAAQVVVSTWSGAHCDEIAFNDQKLVDRAGVIHNVSFDAIPVPPELLREDANTFTTNAATTDHGIEINWPGPALLVEYAEPPAERTRYPWGSVTVASDIRGLRMALANERLQMEYSHHISQEGFYMSAIRRLESAGTGKNVAPNVIDGGSHRGVLIDARVIADETDHKTVHLEWRGTSAGDRRHYHTEVTMYPNSNVLRLDYLIYNVNEYDIASAGSHYVFHGMADWLRPLQYYPESYYNRQKDDKYQDPADAGSLNYHAWFVMGLHDDAGVGYARVAPVADIDVIKLLFKRGFEIFPCFGREHHPTTQYIFTVTGGADEILDTGRRIADGTAVPRIGH
jgi:hypothetical protein